MFARDSAVVKRHKSKEKPILSSHLTLHDKHNIINYSGMFRTAAGCHITQKINLLIRIKIVWQKLFMVTVYRNSTEECDL